MTRWPAAQKGPDAIDRWMLRLITHRAVDLRSFLEALQLGRSPQGADRVLAIRKLRGLHRNVAEVNSRVRRLAGECLAAMGEATKPPAD